MTRTLAAGQSMVLSRETFQRWGFLSDCNLQPTYVTVMFSFTKVILYRVGETLVVSGDEFFAKSAKPMPARIFTL